MPKGIPKRINAQCRGALLGRIIIGNHRMGGRAAPGFAHADTNAGNQQMPEICGQTGKGGKKAPNAKRGRNQIAPIAAVNA